MRDSYFLANATDRPQSSGPYELDYRLDENLEKGTINFHEPPEFSLTELQDSMLSCARIVKQIGEH